MKVFIFILLLILPQTAFADGIEIERVHVTLAPDFKGFDFTLIPQHPDLDRSQIMVPEGCTLNEVEDDLSFIGIASKFNVDCEMPLTSKANLTLPFISNTVYVTYSDIGTSTPASFMLNNNGRESFEIGLGATAPRTFFESIQEFLMLGIIHILAGWDHLSFVFCLCFIALGRRLIFLVTAFTIGHSISMALAYLGIVSFPVPPIEATIALSILFVAREAWMVQFRKPVGFSFKQPALWGSLSIVTLFGLIHGLGFASVLLDLSISKSEQITGLIFFNIGVEVGQLIFIAFVLLISGFLKKLPPWTLLLRGSLLAVGSLGTFWTLERIAGF